MVKATPSPRLRQQLGEPRSGGGVDQRPVAQGPSEHPRRAAQTLRLDRGLPRPPPPPLRVGARRERPEASDAHVLGAGAEPHPSPSTAPRSCTPGEGRRAAASRRRFRPGRLTNTPLSTDPEQGEPVAPGMWRRTPLTSAVRCSTIAALSPCDSHRGGVMAVGWKSSTTLPEGSSSRICLPPGPLRMSLRNRAPALRKRATSASTSSTIR